MLDVESGVSIGLMKAFCRMVHVPRVGSAKLVIVTN